MHRVYNWAFMHMLRDEDNAGYRKVMRDTLEFDPVVLARFVNFLTNPDERPAAEQFGTGDKAFSARRCSRRCPGCRCSATARSRASASATAWSSGGRAGTRHLTRGWWRRMSNCCHRCSIGAATTPKVRDFLLYDVVGSDPGTCATTCSRIPEAAPGRLARWSSCNRFAETEGWMRESSPWRGQAA